MNNNCRIFLVMSIKFIYRQAQMNGVADRLYPCGSATNFLYLNNFPL